MSDLLACGFALQAPFENTTCRIKKGVVENGGIANKKENGAFGGGLTEVAVLCVSCSAAPVSLPAARPSGRRR